MKFKNIIYIYYIPEQEELCNIFMRRYSGHEFIMIPHDGTINQLKRFTEKIISQKIKFKIVNAFELKKIPNKIYHEKPQVVIPLSVRKQVLKQLINKEIRLPLLQDHYEKLKLLYKYGFKDFNFYSLEGLYNFKIDYFLNDFKNIHNDKRCFIVGNGPSLKEQNVSLLKDEITFGSNRCYLGYDKWNLNFKYWGICDRLQIEHYGYEYEDNIPKNTIKFIPFEYISYLKFDNACPVRHHYEYDGFPKFSSSSENIYLGNTVTYFLLQIAVVMGCNPIILIGVDHNYNLNLKNKEYSSTWSANDAKQPTHFDSRYTKGNETLKFIQPRPERADIAFDCAAKWCYENNVNVLNATPNSKLKSFSSVDFNTLF